LIYIVVALKAEAQAFVEKYKLIKSKLDGFVVYKNSDMLLIISSIGVEASRKATQTLINNYDIDEKDIFINVGICGASKNYNIAELLYISKIEYNEIQYTLKDKGEMITCVDKEMSDDIYNIVDMESYGFYDAVIHNPAIKTYHIYKIVSDHFEPSKVSKDGAKKLLADKLKEII
jgi:hypothetical protein